MLETRLKGLHREYFWDRWGYAHTTLMELRHQQIRVLPPRKGKNKGLPALQLTVLYAQERRPPLNRKPLSWKLITNLLIESKAYRG